MWRRRSAALQIVWVLACPGPPRRYRRALELWLSVVFKGRANNRTLNNITFHWAATVERCQLVPGLTLEAERNMHTSGRVVANRIHTTPSWNGPCILERNELKRLKRLF